MLVLGAFFGLFALLGIVTVFLKKTEKEAPVEVTIAKETVSTDDLWRQTMQDKLKSQEDILNQEVTSLKQDVTTTKSTLEKSTIDQAVQIQKSIDDLRKELDTIRTGNSVVEEKKEVKGRPINQYVLNLDTSQKQIKTADNYIPAGSFAKAVLLSGVDASTSLNSSADPEPVLIRIIDHGTLPRRFKSDLKDCHIIGAAFGDLSSQRAKVRLEKLSCTESSTGEIIETAVAGFVAGEDGRQGLRGTVVSMDEKLLTNAFISGTLGGLANNFNSTTSEQALNIFNVRKKPDLKERVQDSFASGATSSLDRLSKYYIDRAESLQPVVQVGAGRKVDVIFTEGVFFGTLEIKKKAKP